MLMEDVELLVVELHHLKIDIKLRQFNFPGQPYSRLRMQKIHDTLQVMVSPSLSYKNAQHVAKSEIHGVGIFMA